MNMLFALALMLQANPSHEIRPIVPTSAPAPIGPYTPGTLAGGYLYVAGQGARRPDGTMPEAFDEQVRQTLENVKAIVQAAGLTMEHVVYMHVYMDNMQNFEAMNRTYASYFPKDPPARATQGGAPITGTPLEINAVAVADLTGKRVVPLPGYLAKEPLSPGILTHDRLFVSGMRGVELASGTVPQDPAKQVDLALDGMKAVLEAAGLSLAHMVFVNPYLTRNIPSNTMNKLYANRFEFGNTPARATISVSSLPGGAQIEFTGVAIRDLSQRRAVRPKNMAPSATASPAVFAGDTLFCSAKSGFIPGINQGVFGMSVEHQLRQTMRNLLDNLEEADMTLDQVVATNVYLDNIDQFAAMNKTYALYFNTPYPARTTIQQVAPTDRKIEGEGPYPTLEQISLIAVRNARPVSADAKRP
jgi:reactive intermediate/imine deaminase